MFNELDFPNGPYPSDKLAYKSDRIVEYRTPADFEGLGTQSYLVKSANPITGVAILTGKDPDLLHLAVRLRAELTHLAPVIIAQVEREAGN